MKAYPFASYPRRMGVKALSLLLALALLAASLPAAALAAPLEATCAKSYTVQSGDTLSKISVTFDISVAELAAANNLKEPYTLYVGQVLCIPGSATTTTTTTTATGSSKKISATFGLKTVTLKFAGLKKNGVFVVKGREVEHGGAQSWHKFGRVKVDKNGAGSATFKMPRDLRDSTYIEICVKNATTDALTCQRFRR